MELGRNTEGRELRTRFLWLGGFFLLGLFVLALNLYRLMVVRYDEFTALSTDNQFKDVRVRAPRGQIKDRRGEVLVDSRPSYDLTLTPAFCQKCFTDVLPQLAELLNWDETTRAAIEARVRAAHGPQRYQGMVVQVDLDADERDRINVRLHLWSGIEIEKVPHRYYPTHDALAHALGYMNEVTQEELVRLNAGKSVERSPYSLGDYIGRRGVERSFENTLRGRDGARKEVVNARGEVMRDQPTNFPEVQARPGNSVVLSIDARLQAEAERVFPGQAGSIVVLDPKTGFILALVSRPSFDPNMLTGRVSSQQLARLSRDPLQPMVFRAVAEHYHPGSTFKLVTLLAGLHSGAFTPNTTVNCPGGYRLGNRTWRCDLERGHGPMDAHNAVQRSCDVYFYRMGDVIGIDAIAKEARALGLGAVTNLSIAAEVPGIIPDTGYHNRVTPGGYTKGMVLNTAIGQGDVNVTPLQLAVMYAALGNGGKVFTPQVVRRVESASGEVLEEFAPKLVRQIEMSPEEHALIVAALKAVVHDPGGTASRARLKDVVVAGKTGTAQVMRLGAVRLKNYQLPYLERDHAWFAAFAPADDPEVVVVVLNEHSGFGGREAAPAAAAVISKYFELKRSDGSAFGPGWQGPPVVKPAALPIVPVAPPTALPVPEPAQLALPAAPPDAGRSQLADVPGRPGLDGALPLNLVPPPAEQVD
ncbi:MAG: putative penicillin-binding protein 2 [Myxococcaceae bacterium]|nr:putative penicillin-binding protein 2 [Myxococcaceae bacterium]